MKWYKRTGLAVLLAAVAVISSTLLSTHIKFGDRCSELTDGFYYGYTADESVSGEDEEGIAAYISGIMAYAEKMEGLVEKYQDSEAERDFRYEINGMKNAFEYNEKDISYINFCYEDLIKKLHTTGIVLGSSDMSEEDAALLEKYKADISEAEEKIKNSSYNDHVRAFRREYDRFPLSWLEDNYIVDFPDYFS